MVRRSSHRSSPYFGEGAGWIASRYTSRRAFAIDHFMQALAIDPLIWAAYEELCVLDNDGSCCVFLALVFLTSFFHHDEISKCIIISLNL
ncbi:hypothetical protein M5K25_008422 [Dendrobium thyrsiflorum]|uniref:Uncharacterized protein n=1 Tax=Dendrobium thyrsiflorum TaxID=117978 RepID=A0ABD0VFT8_DENTH